MKFLLIVFSILFLQLVAAETEVEFEERLDQMQIEHERDNAEGQARRKEARRQTVPPKPKVNITEEYSCLPYSDYLQIMELNFENETQAKMSEENYKTNCEYIEQHNTLYQFKIVTYLVGKNHLLHQTFEEAKASLCGTVLPQQSRSLPISPDDFPEPSGTDADEKFFSQYYGPAKDQGSCGSCWAFAAAGIAEAKLTKHMEMPICGSEQMLIDCDKSNAACDGGWPANALLYIGQFGLSNCEYAYDNEEKVCRRKSFKRSIQPKRIKSTEVTLNGDEKLLKAIIAEKGSVAAIIHGSENLMSYASGVYLDDTCPSSAEDVNHAVIICGYGKDPEFGDYWVVRNSWGPFWGESGYIKVARGRNTCGIASTTATYVELL